MNRLAAFLYRWRIVLSAALAIGAVVLLPRAVSTTPDNGISAWCSRDDALYRDYERFQLEFGGTQPLIIAFQSVLPEPGAPAAGLFTRARLQFLKEITEEIARIPSVQRVQSLATAPALRASPGAAADVEETPALDLAPVLDLSRRSPEEIRRLAVDDPLYRGELVSQDGWGAVADAGYLTEHDGVAQRLARIGVRGVPVRQLLNALPELLVSGATQVSVHSMDWRRLGTFLPAMTKGSRLATMRGGLGADDESLPGGDEQWMRERLLGMPVPERRVFIEAVIQRELARLLGTAPEEIDTARPVIELGVDSLMAVELGVALGRTLQMDVPAMTLLGGSSIAQFAATLCPATDTTAADAPVAFVSA